MMVVEGSGSVVYCALLLLASCNHGAQQPAPAVDTEAMGAAGRCGVELQQYYYYHYYY
jgi:hypothetical protein